MKRVPAGGIVGVKALREAASEFRDVISLVRGALEHHYRNPMGDAVYMPMEAIYPDVVITHENGRYYSHGYSVGDDNVVTLSERKEVTREFTAVRESVESPFIEALDGGESAGTRWEISVVKAGASVNGNFYPDAVLREAVSLFNGVRVFVKSNEDHLKGKGKDARNVIGRLSEARFVEGKSANTGAVHATLELLSSASDFPARLLEAYNRGMTDLYGFSIDALANTKKRGKFREATKFRKINSLDLIVEPSAGGGLVNLIESVVDPVEETDEMKQRMIEAIKKANKGQLPEGLDVENAEQLLEAYNATIQPNNTPQETPDNSGNGNPAAGGEPAAGSLDVNDQARLVEARIVERSNMREAISGSNFPDAVKKKLQKRMDADPDMTMDQLTESIEEERDMLSSLTESGHVAGLGAEGTATHGEDQSEKIATMFDDFFDPDKPAKSFRECYIQVTGDKRVTGLMQHCDAARLREAVGDTELREAISAATFGDVLGNSITRAMVREYAASENYRDFRDLVDVVPINDFRTQERTRVGGYGNLPAVAENAPYGALASPTDEVATYAISKRGGLETVSIEAIANDDVGVIQRIPRKLGVAAARTLYEFVLDFLATNPTIYDTLALFVAGHNNLGTAALSDVAFAAARLAVKQQAELNSNKRIGLVLRHLWVPSELEETAYDLFVRQTNNDETFVQSRKPMVHVVDYWTDTNNWFATADKREVPLIELGFYGGNEEPELFIQDTPTQGSLFSNDQIRYKIRHIYGGNVEDFRGFYGAIVP